MKNKQDYIIKYLVLLVVIFDMTSCSTTKYVPDGEYLLNKVYVKTDVKEYGATELMSYVRQVPNSRMFWLNKTQLQIYSLSGKDSSRWINRQLKKMGEPPVIFDSALVYKTDVELQKFFVNKGYIKVNVTSETQIKRKKKINVTYYITTNESYRIRNYESDIADSSIHEDLYGSGRSVRISGEQSALKTPLVNQGMLFDRNILDAERDRITRLLRNRGYYAFSKDYITYDADSTLNTNAVDLLMRLHPYPEFLPTGDFIEVPHQKYFIDKVYIYTDYDPLRSATEGDNYLVNDSITRGAYTIYFAGKSPSIRPNVLIAHNYLNPKRAYSQAGEETTYSAYSGLSAIANIQLRYEEKMRNDTSFLNCHILAMPTRKQSVSFSVEGTNSAGDFGIASSIGYTHRNIFKGSETFNIKLRGAYEAVSEYFANNYLDLGVETSIRFPKVLFPFVSYSFARRIRASTEFAFGYNYQTRPEYDRKLVSGSLKYLWQSRTAAEARHQVNLVDVSYISVPRISNQFRKRLYPSALLFGYTNQFIVGTGYLYSYSTFNPFQKQRNAYSLKTSVETAGNALTGICNLFNLSQHKEDSYELFGIPYAQYVKGDIDYSKTIFLDKNNSIAWHVGGGIAYPYGNGKEIPFEKRYYSGGANSVRGWGVRALGPGKYVSDENTTFYNQTGDIKLDLNLEYRTKFFWRLELATYIDAGNIWTTRNYDWQSGGQFQFNTFYKEIAMSYGLGLRLDFDFFLIRLDTGVKAYNPEKEGKDCWAILHPNFRENFAWCIAVGYPF